MATTRPNRTAPRRYSAGARDTLSTPAWANRAPSAATAPTSAGSWRERRRATCAPTDTTTQPNAATPGQPSSAATRIQSEWVVRKPRS